MEHIITFSLICMLLAVPATLFAQEGRGNGRGNDDGQGVGGGQQIIKTQEETERAEMDKQGNGNQNQNRVQEQTANQGEEQALQNNVEEQEGQMEKKPNPRSQNAREHMSAVAGYVERLLSNSELEEEIGPEVRQIAQEQKESQINTEQELGKIEKKSSFMKKLFGPDYKAIKRIRTLTEQNPLRIMKLEELKTRVQNENEQTQIQELIQALTNQNIALEKQIGLEESTPSLFGWLVRWFNR